MPGAVIVRSMPNERYCVLGLKSDETEAARTKLNSMLPSKPGEHRCLGATLHHSQIIVGI